MGQYRYIVDEDPEGGLPRVRRVKERRPAIDSTLHALRQMSLPRRTRLATILSVVVGERLCRRDRAERFRITAQLLFWFLILGPPLIILIHTIA